MVPPLTLKDIFGRSEALSFTVRLSKARAAPNANTSPRVSPLGLLGSTRRTKPVVASVKLSPPGLALGTLVALGVAPVSSGSCRMPEVPRPSKPLTSASGTYSGVKDETRVGTAVTLVKATGALGG